VFDDLGDQLRESEDNLFAPGQDDAPDGSSDDGASNDGRGQDQNQGLTGGRDAIEVGLGNSDSNPGNGQGGFNFGNVDVGDLIDLGEVLGGESEAEGDTELDGGESPFGGDSGSDDFGSDFGGGDFGGF
jgi:hypothetical protein